MVAALEEGWKTTKMGEKEERMDFTERLELYREGDMITDENVKTILEIIAMFREKYDIVLCEENADTFIAHLCAAFFRVRTGEPVEPLMEEVFAEVKETETYPLSVEMLKNIEAILGGPFVREEQEYVLLHINSLLDKLQAQP